MNPVLNVSVESESEPLGWHCSYDDAAAAGGVCWLQAFLSVWLAAVLSSVWVWFLQSGVPLAGNQTPVHFTLDRNKEKKDSL